MYHNLEAELHDLFWSLEGAPAELLLIEEFLRGYRGKALEIGCGSGRLMIPLLEKGYELDGLDSSKEMLDLFRTRSKGEFSDLKLHQVDMRQFVSAEKYNAITIPAFTLQFLSHQDLPDFFDQLNNMLTPNGGLYLTTFIPWAEIAGELEEDTWYADNEAENSSGEKAICETRFTIYRLSQRLVREHRYILKSKSGETRKTTSEHDLHWFWLNELKQLLQVAGFETKRVITDFSQNTTPEENAHILTVFAEKLA